MGLRADAQALAKTAMDAVGDLARPIEYEVHTGRVYDTAQGKTAPSYGGIRNARGVVTSYSLRDVDGTLLRPNDRKVVVARSDLGADITPKPEDRIRLDLIYYDIVSVQSDAANAVWRLQVRQQGS